MQFWPSRAGDGDSPMSNASLYFYSSIAQVAAAIVALMGIIVLNQLVKHVLAMEDELERVRAMRSREDIKDNMRKVMPESLSLVWIVLSVLSLFCIVWPLWLLEGFEWPKNTMLAILIIGLAVFLGYGGLQFKRLHSIRGAMADVMKALPRDD